MRIWVALVVMVGALLAAGLLLLDRTELAASKQERETELAQLQADYETVLADLVECRRRQFDEEFYRRRASEALENQAMLMHTFEIAQLKREGLTDPVRQLREDLASHRELIPFEGVHGGTMGFYYPGSIALLDAQWVFARFEDGHIGGSCLLEYEILPGGEIKWSVIKARLWQTS